MCIVTQMSDARAPSALAAYGGFAVFGAFWGTWGASIPAIRDQSGVSDGQLGTALLFVGAGALPAMLVSGRAVDRWPRRVSAVVLVALGLAGILVAVTARDLVSLSIGLTALGASSGAADVAINTAAGSAERALGRAVITRAHGVFSAMVVVMSLVTGALATLGAPLITPFVIVAAAAVTAAVRVSVVGPFVASSADGSVPVTAPRPAPTVRLAPLLVIGALGALAFAVENAHQSWSAVYLGDVLATGPALAAAGPAVFAAVVAVTRFAVSPVAPRHATVVLAAGAGTSAAGTLLLATASSVPAALLGLAIAAAGTAVTFPMLLSVLTANLEDRARGRATSVVTVVAYLGFLAGPVYVGRWAEAVDLSGAFVAVAALAALLAAVAFSGPRAVRAASREA